jgi:uncharacterized membrane protein YcaP (DUF421 family)
MIVTVTIGSVVAGSTIAQPPSFARGAVAVATLLALQLVVGAVRQRVPVVRRFLDFTPDLVYADGHTRLSRSPLKAQLTQADIDRAMRSSGTPRSKIVLIVLEADGTFSIMTQADDPTER